MKQRSKVFLMVAAVLVGVGLITCLIGAGISSAAEDPLFASSLEEGKGYRYPFDGSKIDKIKLDVVDAKIQIIGGAKESYIEILHFNENLYSFSMSKSLISFKESPDVSSVLRFWESGFTFKGLRYILRLAPQKGEKAIHVYLTDDDYMKCLEVKSRTANISASDLETDTDYIFTMEDGGSVKMENVTTGSALSVTSTGTQPCAVELENTTARLLTLNLTEGDVQAKALSAFTSKIDVVHGSINLDYIPREDLFTIAVNTKGKLSVNETGYIDKYQYTTKEEDTQPDDDEELEEETLTINCKDAAVYLFAATLPGDTQKAK